MSAAGSLDFRKMGKKKRTRSKRRKEKRDEHDETAETVEPAPVELVAAESPIEEAAAKENTVAAVSNEAPAPVAVPIQEAVAAKPSPARSEPTVHVRAAAERAADISPETLVAEIAIPRFEPEPEIALLTPASIVTTPVTVVPVVAPDPATLARLWRRLAAFIYDVLLLVLFNLVLFVGALYLGATRFMEPIADVAQPFQPSEAKRYFVVALSVGIFVSWLYMTLLEALPPGATLGKQIFNIRTTDLYGKRISFARSTTATQKRANEIRTHVRLNRRSRPPSRAFRAATARSRRPARARLRRG